MDANRNSESVDEDVHKIMDTNEQLKVMSPNFSKTNQRNSTT